MDCWETALKVGVLFLYIFWGQEGGGGEGSMAHQQHNVGLELMKILFLNRWGVCGGGGGGRGGRRGGWLTQ